MALLIYHRKHFVVCLIIVIGGLSSAARASSFMSMFASIARPSPSSFPVEAQLLTLSDVIKTMGDSEYIIPRRDHQHSPQTDFASHINRGTLYNLPDLPVPFYGQILTDLPRTNVRVLSYDGRSVKKFFIDGNVDAKHLLSSIFDEILQRIELSMPKKLHPTNVEEAKRIYSLVHLAMASATQTFIADAVFATIGEIKEEYRPWIVPRAAGRTCIEFAISDHDIAVQVIQDLELIHHDENQKVTVLAGQLRTRTETEFSFLTGDYTNSRIILSKSEAQLPRLLHCLAHEKQD